MVFRGDVERDALDDAFARLDLRLVNVVPKTAALPRQIIAAAPDGSVTVTVAEDDRLGVVYAVVDGARADVIARDLASAIGAVEPEWRVALALGTLGGTILGPGASS